MKIEKESQNKKLCSFGLILGTAFTLISLWPYIFRGEEPRSWGIIIAGILITQSLFLPKTLRGFYRVWMIVGAALGWLNTRIILTFCFYVVLTPIGLIMRVTGRDPMRRRFDASAKSYRVNRTERAASHMEKQY